MKTRQVPLLKEEKSWTPFAITPEPEDKIFRWLKPFVRHCGNPTHPPWHLGKRRLPDYLLMAVREGHGFFTLGSTRYEMREGDLFWVPPNTEHEFEGDSDSMSAPYVHFDLVYRGRKSDYVFDVPEGLRDLTPYRRLIHPTLPRGNPFDALAGRLRTPFNQRIIELMVAICNEAARSQPFVRCKTSGLMMEILCELLRGLQGVPTSYAEHLPLLERAETFIRSHCAETLTIAAIARFCGISSSELRLLFAKHHDCPPRTFIRRCRIEKAKELLVEHEDLNITEVAELAGFAGIHSFSRAFRQFEGLAPSRYRLFGKPHVHSEERSQLQGTADPRIENYVSTRQRMLRLKNKREEDRTTNQR